MIVTVVPPVRSNPDPTADKVVSKANSSGEPGRGMGRVGEMRAADEICRDTVKVSAEGSETGAKSRSRSAAPPTMSDVFRQQIRQGIMRSQGVRPART